MDQLRQQRDDFKEEELSGYFEGKIMDKKGRGSLGGTGNKKWYHEWQ